MYSENTSRRSRVVAAPTVVTSTCALQSMFDALAPTRAAPYTKTLKETLACPAGRSPGSLPD